MWKTPFLLYIIALFYVENYVEKSSYPHFVIRIFDYFYRYVLQKCITIIDLYRFLYYIYGKGGKIMIDFTQGKPKVYSIRLSKEELSIINLLAYRYGLINESNILSFTPTAKIKKILNAILVRGDKGGIKQ